MDPIINNSLKTDLYQQLTATLTGIGRGIERESLRVDTSGHLAKTQHPAALGSALTNRFITTDYAEAMLEFITPLRHDAGETIDILADIHTYTYQQLEGEQLWPLSMPSPVDSADDIALAHYGNSNLGKQKTTYRRGLKNRYGSMMQVISGIHYNFSMPASFWPVWQKIKGNQEPLQDFITSCYLGLIRNFLRHGWLIPYLFGASPALDASFLNNFSSPLKLEKLGQRTACLPYSTSLRMSPLGYSNKSHKLPFVGYNCLSQFISGLRHAMAQTNEKFARIGLQSQGVYQQLNTNTLQNESEFYAPIRPKCEIKPGSTLTSALEEKGIEYVEVRALDINPYAATGITLEEIRFLDIFLSYCLLTDSPELSEQQQLVTEQNMTTVASNGRKPHLYLWSNGAPRALSSWADEIFCSMAKIARLLDDAHSGDAYFSALEEQRLKLCDPELTPSARLLKDLREDNLELVELGRQLAQRQRSELQGRPLKVIHSEQFADEVQRSNRQQTDLEANDSVSFPAYLRHINTLHTPHEKVVTCHNSICLSSCPPASCVDIS